jgi:hypothetical protein
MGLEGGCAGGKLIPEAGFTNPLRANIVRLGFTIFGNIDSRGLHNPGEHVLLEQDLQSCENRKSRIRNPLRDRKSGPCSAVKG